MEHDGRSSQNSMGKKGLDHSRLEGCYAAVRKAGRTGKAKSSDLKKVVDEIGLDARGW